VGFLITILVLKNRPPTYIYNPQISVVWKKSGLKWLDMSEKIPIIVTYSPDRTPIKVVKGINSVGIKAKRL